MITRGGPSTLKDCFMDYSEEGRRRVWNKADPIQGKDPDKWRVDKYGNEMFYYSYGKTSEKGWEIDHSKPKSQGGTDHLNNLQPLNTKENRQKGGKYPYKPGNK